MQTLYIVYYISYIFLNPKEKRVKRGYDSIKQYRTVHAQHHLIGVNCHLLSANRKISNKCSDNSPKLKLNLHYSSGQHRNPLKL